MPSGSCPVPPWPGRGEAGPGLGRCCLRAEAGLDLDTWVLRPAGQELWDRSLCLGFSSQMQPPGGRASYATRQHRQTGRGRSGTSSWSRCPQRCHLPAPGCAGYVPAGAGPGRAVMPTAGMRTRDGSHTCRHGDTESGEGRGRLRSWVWGRLTPVRLRQLVEGPQEALGVLRHPCGRPHEGACDGAALAQDIASSPPPRPALLLRAPACPQPPSAQHGAPRDGSRAPQGRRRRLLWLSPESGRSGPSPRYTHLHLNAYG